MINAKQQEVFNQLVRDENSSKCTEVVFSELKESEHGTVSFIISTDFRINPFCSSKSKIGMIGPRGKVTIWS